jgi:hypothetical protein
MRWGGVEGEVSLGDPAALTLTLTCWRAAECRHPTGGEKMGSPTLQTHQDPVLLPCLRGEPNPNLGHNLSTLVLSTLNHTARSYILPVQATKHVLGCAPGTLTRTPPLTYPGMSRHSPLARGAAVRTISPSSASRVSVRVCVSVVKTSVWDMEEQGQGWITSVAVPTFSAVHAEFADGGLGAMHTERFVLACDTLVTVFERLGMTFQLAAVEVADKKKHLMQPHVLRDSPRVADLIANDLKVRTLNRAVQ